MTMTTNTITTYTVDPRYGIADLARAMVGETEVTFHGTPNDDITRITIRFQINAIERESGGGMIFIVTTVNNAKLLVETTVQGGPITKITNIS